jgi:hypothetical protein
MAFEFEREKELGTINNRASQLCNYPTIHYFLNGLYIFKQMGKGKLNESLISLEICRIRQTAQSTAFC